MELRLSCTKPPIWQITFASAFSLTKYILIQILRKFVLAEGSIDNTVIFGPGNALVADRLQGIT